MKKEDTIQLYIEEYLSDKSDEQKTEFRNRDIARQYSTIMAWKRRRSLKVLEQQSDASSILAALRQVRMSIEASKDMSETDMNKIKEAVTQISESIASCELRRDLREIEELQRRQDEINRRLETLRGKTAAVSDNVQ